MKHQVRLLALALGLCLGFIKGGHVLAHNLDSYEFKLEIGHQDLSYLVNESGVKHYVSLR